MFIGMSIIFFSNFICGKPIGVCVCPSPYSDHATNYEQEKWIPNETRPARARK